MGLLSFRQSRPTPYARAYHVSINAVEASLLNLLDAIETDDVNIIRSSLDSARIQLKKADIWLRYLEPNDYKKLNAPLKVEWEVEVFEKWERPYRRDGAGLILAEWYLDNGPLDSMASMVHQAFERLGIFRHDSVTSQLSSFDHFLFANRLHLLNLATIYTSAFECPNTERIVPELKAMLSHHNQVYLEYNYTFSQKIEEAYIDKYRQMLNWVLAQSDTYLDFDHYYFIREFVNPLFGLNQAMITKYRAQSVNFSDFSLNDEARSIFSKDLYQGQERLGLYKGLKDPADIARLERVGQILFNDPLLSVNNQRSCASCHKTQFFFTDTVPAALQINGHDVLERNTPTLVNAMYNHLMMVDGEHITAMDQAIAVVQDPMEMGSELEELFKRICKVKYYRKNLKELAEKTLYDELQVEHVFSALMAYYSSEDQATNPFDWAMNGGEEVEAEVIRGFNLFMGKAECATCHFAPHFNGVKPPYIGSEFEVLGTPEDTSFAELSKDLGRAVEWDVPEMRNAFRTPSLRNVARTRPYMHNGVFNSLEEVVDFYNKGGGVGRGLDVPNQSLNDQELLLTPQEQQDLVAFLKSLNEDVFLHPKVFKPKIRGRLNEREMGGTY